MKIGSIDCVEKMDWTCNLMLCLYREAKAIDPVLSSITKGGRIHVCFVTVPLTPVRLHCHMSDNVF